MRLNLFEAHLLCLAIVTLDILGRALRLRWYLKGLGTDLTVAHALTATVWGDAAAGLTPLRFGGEAAKFAGLMRGGVRPGVALLGLGLEAVVTYPLVFAFGFWLTWRYAPSWWSSAGPLVAQAVATGWPWLVGIVLLTLAGGGVALRWHRQQTIHEEKENGVGGALRRVPRWVVLAGIPLSLFNIAGRTIVLPLLASTLPVHPPFGVMMLGSFALLYSQLLLPMPAGVGAVDFGFLAGVAGDLGPARGGLLLAWRFYTVGVGAALGIAIAAHTLGWPALRRLLLEVRASNGKDQHRGTEDTENTEKDQITL